MHTMIITHSGSLVPLNFASELSSFIGVTEDSPPSTSSIFDLESYRSSRLNGRVNLNDILPLVNDFIDNNLSNSSLIAVEADFGRPGEHRVNGTLLINVLEKTVLDLITQPNKKDFLYIYSASDGALIAAHDIVNTYLKEHKDKNFLSRIDIVLKNKMSPITEWKSHFGKRANTLSSILRDRDILRQDICRADIPVPCSSLVTSRHGVLAAPVTVISAPVISVVAVPPPAVADTESGPSSELVESNLNQGHTPTIARSPEDSRLVRRLSYKATTPTRTRTSTIITPTQLLTLHRGDDSSTERSRDLIKVSRRLDLNRNLHGLGTLTQPNRTTPEVAQQTDETPGCWSQIASLFSCCCKP